MRTGGSPATNVVRRWVGRTARPAPDAARALAPDGLDGLDAPGNPLAPSPADPAPDPPRRAGADRAARAGHGPPRLLLVDGDVAVRAMVARALPTMVVCVAGSARRALRLLAAGRFAAAILDVDLPDGDGRELCADLRRRGLALPILMLSRLGQEADVVRGLEAGADDYVVKPFRPGELAARVRAQLRHRDGGERAELRVGDQTFRPADRTVTGPGQPRPVRLTEREAALLKYLHRADGRAVGREELFHHVWGRDADPRSRTLETHVHRLRRKVEPHADSPRLLLRSGGGYRLVRAGVAAPGRGVRGGRRHRGVDRAPARTADGSPAPAAVP